MATNYIRDGYTRDEFLKGDGRLCADLNFSYRPVPPDERDEYVRVANAARDAAGRNLVYRGMVKKYLTRWDNVYPDDHPDSRLSGKQVPIDDDGLQHLPYPIWTRLVDILLGLAYGDLPPDPTAMQSDQWQKDVQRLLNGDSPGDAQSAADAKNSATG